MISFTHSRLYKDIGSKAFFTMATLLMPLLENDISSTTSVILNEIDMIQVCQCAPTTCFVRDDISIHYKNYS